MLQPDSFQPIYNASPQPGLVLRTGDGRHLRITHVFGDCVYSMWIGEPKDARYAGRPIRMPMATLMLLAAEPSSMWGRIPLPRELSNSPEEGSTAAESLSLAWELVKPLIAAFSVEENLARSRFTSLITAHARKTETTALTLMRMVSRYYYFGGSRLGLLPLRPGAKARHSQGIREEATSRSESRPSRRPGRDSILAKKLGTNDFIVAEDDIADMVTCLKRCLRKGPTFKTTAHEEYLATEFRRRHPTIYAEYIAGKRVEPVTIRQYRYYTDIHANLGEELTRNLRKQERNPGHLSAVVASGPGEVYEIDSTGGRLYLVSSDDPPVVLGKPTIYLMIDRWSRFVVSAYLSLRPPSYEEVRYALLIAFTSREARFHLLGVDISDERWPIGRVPAVICPDRGAEFMGDSMERAVVQDLKIELTPLPPLCPDGKAIVERLIREVKRRMASSGMQGVYADRPLDPRTKRAARKAQAAAVHSLAVAYRVLIEIIDDHNNRPHTALRRMRALAQAGVPPVPKDAYLWGLKNITGMRTPPLSDGDYYQLLLGSDTANIAKGIIRYKGRPYLPDNEAGFDLAHRSTGRAKQIRIRVDRSNPKEIFVANSTREWARFSMPPGAADELAGLSLDEEDALSSETSRLWAEADHQGRVQRVTARSERSRPHKARGDQAIRVSRQEQLDMSTRETDKLKSQLLGTQSQPWGINDQARPPSPSLKPWVELEEEERLRNLELIRKQRKKR